MSYLDTIRGCCADPYADAEEDRVKTGQVRCIGCGKFVRRSRNWNQCPDCDTREPEEMPRFTA